MLYFINDYSEGAHEKVLQHLIDTNMEQLAGYGMDHYCEAAKEKIKKACGCEDAEVFLLTGGTQTNQIVIDTLLQPYEGVVAAQTGHVSTHEAGAIEFTGHKVLELPQKDGKICAAVLKKGLQEKGYRFLLDSPTNQQFIILEDTRLEELRKYVQFSFWEKTDASHTAVRFATSWATRMEDVQKLLCLL